jgi:hypothetical protein
MYPKTRKNPVFIVAAALAVLALTASACSFIPVEVSTDLLELDIDIPVDELELQSLIGPVHSDDPCGQLLDEITHVELQDGFIRFEGTKVQADGSRAAGSLDVSLGAENDMLKIQIVAVDIPGIDLSHPCIVKANRELEYELSHLAIDSPGEVLFKDVTIDDGQLRMKIQVKVDGLPDPAVWIEID